MKTHLKICLALSLIISGIVHAQGNTPPKPLRAEGTVTALSDTAITLLEANGVTETIALLPEFKVYVSKQISIEQIVPGSYVATANKEKPDGTGVSIEIRVSPPGTNGVNVNRVMDPEAQTVMTNGTVSTVVKSVEGRVLQVNYGTGVRQITVPLDIPIIAMLPGDRSVIKVGSKTKVVNFAMSPDRPVQQFITVESEEKASK